MLSWIRLLNIFYLTIFFHFYLVNILVKLSDLVHQALISSTMFTHFVAILLKKTIFLDLDLLESLYLLCNLLLKFLLQCDDDSATIVEQVGKLIILGE